MMSLESKETCNVRIGRIFRIIERDRDKWRKWAHVWGIMTIAGFAGWIYTAYLLWIV